MPTPFLAPGFTENVVSEAGATTISLGVPSSTVNGELLLAHTAWRGDGAHSNTEAAFTEIVDNTQANGPSLGVYSRVASSEPALYNFGFSGAAARVLAFMARIIGGTTVEAFATNDGGGVAGTTFVAPSVTSLGEQRLLVCIFVSTHTDTFLTPSQMTVFDSNNSGGSVAGIVRYNLCVQKVGTGATGTREAYIAVARQWVSASLLIAPTAVTDDSKELGSHMRTSLIALGHTQSSINDQLYSYWNGKSSLGLEASVSDHKQNFLSSFPGESVQEQEINWMKTKAGVPSHFTNYQDVAYWFWSTGGMA